MLTLCVLPYQLGLLSVPQKDFCRLTHLLLEHLFFSKQTPPFFSLSKNDIEVSLVLDWQLLETLDPKIGSRTDDVLSVLQIEGDDPDGILRISAPLAKAGISIFYLVTFQSDFVLVRQKRLEKVRSVLKQAGFELTDPSCYISNETNTALQSDSYIESVSMPTYSPKLVPELNLVMTGLDPDFEHTWTLELIRLLFFTPARFVSFTFYINEGYSIICPDEILAQILGLEKTGKFYALLEVDLRSFGLDQYGIVHSLSEKILRDNKIEMFYLSTYNYGNILVPVENLALSLERLQCREIKESTGSQN